MFFSYFFIIVKAFCQLECAEVILLKVYKTSIGRRRRSLDVL